MLRKRICFILVIVIIMLNRIFKIPQHVVLAAEKEVAEIETKVISTKEKIRSTKYIIRNAAASKSPITQFIDQEGRLNIAYEGNKVCYITVFNMNNQINHTIEIPKRYPILGGVAYDKGFYYIVYGNNNVADDLNKIVASVVKYDNQGKYISEVTYSSSELSSNHEGTICNMHTPFLAGNVRVLISNGALLCSYSGIGIDDPYYEYPNNNHILYVDVNHMIKLNKDCFRSYTISDQRVIVTEDNSYLFVDQRPYNDRGFNLLKINLLDVDSNINIYSEDFYEYYKKISKNLTPFHFREESKHEFGIDQTYAQLGGIAECSTGYVLVACSEKELSYEPSPGSIFNTSRNLFFQIIKKDFEPSDIKSCFTILGEERNAVGLKSSEDLWNSYIKQDTVDYGVNWITNYSDEFYCSSPKVAVNDDDQIIIMWEKRKYKDNSLVDSYYMILDSQGKIIHEATSLGEYSLDANQDILYHNGIITWTTSLDNCDDYNLYVHRLKVGSYKKQRDISQLTYKKTSPKLYSVEGNDITLPIYDKKKKLVKNVDYTVTVLGQNCYTCEWKLKVSGMGAYKGSKNITVAVKPKKAKIESMYTEKNCIAHIPTYSLHLLTESYGSSLLEVQVSENKDFRNAKVLDAFCKGYEILVKLYNANTYYVRVRGYTFSNGKKVYGEFSDVKKVKVK